MKKIIKSVTAILLAAFMILTMVPSEYTKADNGIITQTGCLLGLKNGAAEMTAAAGGKYAVAQQFEFMANIDSYSAGHFEIEVGDKGSDVIKIENFSVKYVNSLSMANSRDIVLNSRTNVVLTYNINVSELAGVGVYTYKVKFVSDINEEIDYSSYSSDSVFYPTGRFLTTEEIGSFEMTINVTSEKMEPTFKLVTAPEFSVKAGNNVTINFTLQNIGELDAYETYVGLGSDKYLIPVDTVLNQKVGLVKKDGQCKLSYTFKVTDDAQTDTLKLPIYVSAKTQAGTLCEDKGNYYIYIKVQGKADVTPTPTQAPEGKPSSLVVSKVSHTPEAPVAGEELSISFTLENNGDDNFKNVKVFVDYSSSTFNPISSDPYFYVGEIKARKSKEVTIKVKCSENIIEGTNTLGLSFGYDTEFGTETGKDSTTIYILNVVGKEEQTVSRPKLMVSDFSSDVNPVMSGGTFNFTFSIKNTNEETRAKNIKVKVTANEFSVTSGSNSFFINEIKPGESYEHTINLKASAAAATGAYPIVVSMEYEYDGMPTGGNYESVQANDELLLQINETLRASLENIMIGDWNPPMVGSPASATFEFYNMGKSVLNNVYVTVEGDFVLATGDSYYMGNMNPGMPEFIECSVIPLVEGDATCIFVIHMEDSNGDEVTSQHSTTVYVGNGENYYDDPWNGDINVPTGEGEIIGYDEFGNPIYADSEGENENDSFLKRFFIKYKVWIFVGIGVIVVAGAAVAVILVRKNKKKKEFDDFEV